MSEVPLYGFGFRAARGPQLQVCLAHKKQHPPEGHHRALGIVFTVGSYRGAVSYERVTHVQVRFRVQGSRYRVYGRTYMGTSLMRNSPPLGPYSRAMPMALWCS